MSTRSHPVDIYGLLLEGTALDAICSKVCPHYTKEAYDDDPGDFIFVAGEKGNFFDIEYEFTGDALPINDDGSTNWSEFSGYSYADDIICYVPLAYCPSFFKPMYHDIDEMISEFKTTIGSYLPEDFNYRHYLRHIVGTYYG